MNEYAQYLLSPEEIDAMLYDLSRREAEVTQGLRHTDVCTEANDRSAREICLCSPEHPAYQGE